ncbi:Beta-hexosaminidase [Tritrichomonas foetus]|uniref:beta-N-acetylhexosaminidase n=1 Tax=Tritrichomonas foetus TaxID=1144522 RepID=A0A1J4JFB4_9EUKA|nr:Beta-hexosaminidase [Tritrichomonas foetus]|eukprot:OHS96339.1 Beta-hexosaminidase [Tritrichomonas foetus]
MLVFLSLWLTANCVPPTIVPYPNSMTVHGGQWSITKDSQIGYNPNFADAQKLANFISDSLVSPLGYRLKVVSDQPSFGIYLDQESESIDEYTLSMDQNVATIYGKNYERLFNGFQSLLQILPPQIYSKTAQTGIEWTAPCVTVVDAPRFQWRGLMVDICRHFFTVDEIKTILDGMCHYKMNTLHFHMTEDQGWRLELKKYPLLTEVGSIRDESPKMWDRNHGDGIPYGPFYLTADDVKEIINYAHDRSITVVPEIEMPGHALACLSGYPQYSCTGGPFKPRCIWGVEEDIFCAGNDDTIQFLEDLLDEVLNIFPSEYIHLGGDECPRTRWEKCPKCQQRMKDNGLTNTDQLQSWFTQHFANYLAAKGHKLIGWDEVLVGGLKFPPEATIMIYHGVDSAITAAQRGHNVIMAQDKYIYLDYYQFCGKETYEYIYGYNSIHRVYHYDPTGGIDDNLKHFIIGAQAQLWSECIWDIEQLQYKAFPRGIALAESTWSKLEDKDFSRFMRDFERTQKERLECMGLNAAPIHFGERAEWKSGDFPANQWVTAEWTVTGVTVQKAQMEAAFLYTSGNHMLRMRNVKMLYDGAVIAEDNHEGTAEENPKNNIYTLNPGSGPGNKKITISAEVYCDGGSDSNGVIYVYGKTL